MKKNININLFGTLYAINEDACTLLENYLDNMRSYFAKRDGGDEIYDDIEHRVAEHLWSLKENGQAAIDINNVKQIISSIGNPDEMESGVEEADDCQSEETPGAEADDATNRQNEDNNVNSQDEANEANRQNEANGSYGKDEDANNHGEGKWTDRVLHHVSPHRFYRDGKDKIGGGVISGLCHYCGGGDIVVWRVATVLFIMAAFQIGKHAQRHLPERRQLGYAVAGWLEHRCCQELWRDYLWLVGRRSLVYGKESYTYQSRQEQPAYRVCHEPQGGKGRGRLCA